MSLIKNEIRKNLFVGAQSIIHKILHFFQHDSSQNMTDIETQIRLEVDNAKISSIFENEQYLSAQTFRKMSSQKDHRSSYT